jgi:hypothetical protein
MLESKSSRIEIGKITMGGCRMKPCRPVRPGPFGFVSSTKSQQWWRRPVIAVLVLTTLSGCSLYEGGPVINDGVWLLQDSTPQADPGAFVPAPCPQPKQNPDDFNNSTKLSECVYAMINLIDVRYEDFERRLFGSTTNTNFVADSAVLGISGAGAFFSGGAAQVMNGVTAGLTGFKSKFDQDILYSKTISVLIQQMRSDRATELNIILQRLQATANRGASVPTSTVQTQATRAATASATVAAGVVASATRIAAQDPNATVTTVAQAATQAVAGATSSGAGTASTNPLPYDNIYQAYTDLHAYAIAGSWSHALISLETDIGASAADAKATVTATKTGTQPATTPRAPGK